MCIIKDTNFALGSNRGALNISKIYSAYIYYDKYQSLSRRGKHFMYALIEIYEKNQYQKKKSD